MSRTSAEFRNPSRSDSSLTLAAILLTTSAVARLADKGQDVSGDFTNKGKMMPPMNLGLDLNQTMLEELNAAAKRLNISRQTLIKRFIRRGLDQHYLAQKVRKAG